MTRHSDSRTARADSRKLREPGAVHVPGSVRDKKKSPRRAQGTVRHTLLCLDPSSFRRSDSVSIPLSYLTHARAVRLELPKLVLRRTEKGSPTEGKHPTIVTSQDALPGYLGYAKMHAHTSLCNFALHRVRRAWVVAQRHTR